MDISVYKQRASSSGKLMTNPRLKKDKEAGNLSKTTTSMLDDWFKEQVFGVKFEINSKYLDKGNIVEKDSLLWLADQLDLGMVFDTNEESFEDDFFKGTPDLITSDRIYDLKNSWSASTFPLIGGTPNIDYYYQLQVYMHLTKRRYASVVYLLSNTPNHLIEKEVRSQIYKIKELGHILSANDESKIESEVRSNHNFDHIPNRFRYRKFDFEYSPEVIAELRTRVVKSREYIEKLKLEING